MARNLADEFQILLNNYTAAAYGGINSLKAARKKIDDFIQKTGYDAKNHKQRKL